MEPNTSSSPAAWTSPAAGLEHGEPSVRAPSHLSPAFSPAPSPGLVPRSGSGSGSSWYEQIPPSPVVAAGNGSLSVHAYATSSQSPPSSFPTAGTLPMVGYDLFGNPEATAATPLPTLLGGQWEQGQSSSRAASSVLPECPSPGLFGFVGKSAAWPSEETSSFFSPSSAGGLAPQSSDNLVGFAQPQSLPISSLAVEESRVDAPLPPFDEEEEIDVSSFPVSDPEDQLSNASWTGSPQMAGSGGGASASWMAPGSTGNNWPPMLAPAAASTCTMLSTRSGSMPCQSSGSSIGVASSMGAMMKPSSPVLPLAPPSSQDAGATSSNFNGFAQPSSSSVLAPHAPNLQGPLLPVKQEVMEYVVDATARRHPDFISLVDDDDDGLYQYAIPSSIPGPAFYRPVPETSSSRGSLVPLGSDSGLNAWTRSSSGHSKGPSFAPEAEGRYNDFGSWGSSPSYAPGSWGGSSSSSSSPSFAPSSWGGGSSSSSSPSFAPGNWPGCSSGSPSFAPGSRGSSSSSSSPGFAPGSWGSNSSSSSPSFPASTPCFDGSTSTDVYGSSSTPKLSIGGKLPSIFGLPPLPSSKRACASRGGDAAGIVFTEHEMGIIRKEKNLQELLRTDPKKVKRILYNRAYSAMAKVRKVMHTKELERLVVTLEMQRKALCEELQSLEEGSAALRAEKMEMQMVIGELEQQAMLKDAVREVLRAEIQKLNHLKLN